jgi:hypothetical protein
MLAIAGIVLVDALKDTAHAGIVLRTIAWPSFKQLFVAFNGAIRDVSRVVTLSIQPVAIRDKALHEDIP